MTATSEGVRTHALTLTEELVLMLLNEESGYFRQVPGWNLDCAIVGSVLAELSMTGRIDTDMNSLILLDDTPTGDPLLDPLLAEIAADSDQRNAQYWIERYARRAEPIVDGALDRLVKLGILRHHTGDFWTLTENALREDSAPDGDPGSATGFVKTRISKAIFDGEIPEPRDIVIICLINTCDLFRFIFELDEENEERIELICRMDLIGRSIAAAVEQNLTGGLFQRPPLSKAIPTAPLRKLLFNRNLRKGNIPAVFADLTRQLGPVYQIKPPFAKPLVFLGGPSINRWANRYARGFLRSQDYLSTFEKVYGAHGIMPALDGADHFRLRKSLAPAYSRKRLAGQLDDIYQHARSEMTKWEQGDVLSSTPMMRQLVNAQISAYFLSVHSQDIFDDLVSFKEQALKAHVTKTLPKFMLKTPGMKRKLASLADLLERVTSGHTPAQRAGCPRDLADDLFSLHASDPQFLPATNLSFALSASLIASMYLGDQLNFAVYAMVTQPELRDRIEAEADALFGGGDPGGEDFSLQAIDVTHRFIMEVLRMYPVVPMSVRTVMNPCVVEGFALPTGTRLHIAQTACHYMEELFPDPFKFDIDRYQAPRNEHRGPGYAPYGLGSHSCMGSHMMEMLLAVNLLMLAHYFKIEVWPPDFKFRINPFPSQSVSKKLKYRITARRREIPA